jgi:hypothetical protein
LETQRRVADRSTASKGKPPRQSQRCPAGTSGWDPGYRIADIRTATGMPIKGARCAIQRGPPVQVSPKFEKVRAEGTSPVSARASEGSAVGGGPKCGAQCTLRPSCECAEAIDHGGAEFG